MKLKKWSLPLAFSLLVLGLLAGVQYNTQQELANSLSSQQTSTLVTMVQNLHEKRNALETELQNLTRTYNSISLVTSLEKQIKQLQIFAGTTNVIGPGISITITTDSYLINLDLVDLVNELWATGAEVIAINDIRINTTSQIASETDANQQPIITLNGKKLLSPIVIKAIGDPTTLETGLTFTGGIIDNLNTLYHVYPTIKQEASLRIPADSNIYSPKYMAKYTPPATQ